MAPGQSLVRGMAAMRMLSATMELTAACLMLRFGRVDAALRINAVLGLVGPALFAAVSALGLAGLAAEVPYPKLALIFAGVLLVVLGATR